MPEPSTVAEFLNVDLDIDADHDLQPLADALGDRVILLYCGPWDGAHRLSIEALAVRADPDRCVRLLVEALNGCLPPARKLWRRARSRAFDIGVRVTGNRGGYHLALRPVTVRRIAEIRGTVALTVYHHDEPRTADEPGGGCVR